MQSTGEVAIRKAESAAAPSPSQVVGRRKRLPTREKRIRILTRKRDRSIERWEERERYTPSEKRNRVKSRGSGRAKKRRVKAPGEVTHRPRPPHSPAHPDYPPPGAGRCVMSIEEVLNLWLFDIFSLLTSKTARKSFNVLSRYKIFYILEIYFKSIIAFFIYKKIRQLKL